MVMRQAKYMIHHCLRYTMCGLSAKTLKKGKSGGGENVNVIVPEIIMIPCPDFWSKCSSEFDRIIINSKQKRKNECRYFLCFVLLAGRTQYLKPHHSHSQTSKTTKMWMQKKRFVPLPLPRSTEALDGPTLFNWFSALKCEYESTVLFMPSCRVIKSRNHK